MTTIQLISTLILSGIIALIAYLLLDHIERQMIINKLQTQINEKQAELNALFRKQIK